MTDSDDSTKEPIAGLSAASSCITISLSSPPPHQTTTASSEGQHERLMQFRPVYTHQCFEKECIAGWRPLIDAEEKSRNIYHSWKEGGALDGDDNENSNGNAGLLHPSYQNCGSNGRVGDARIDIHAVLSPSCDQCQIEIRTDKDDASSTPGKGNDDIGVEPAPKRVKTVSFQGLEPANDVQDEGQHQMDISEVVTNISLALPPIVSVTVNGNLVNKLVPALDNDENCNDSTELASKRKSSADEKTTSGYVTKPIGRPLKTYHRKIKFMSSSKDDAATSLKEEEESKFVVTIANGSDPEVKKYHDAIQPLARWFIETADDVDVSDSSRGEWKIMYLFCYHDNESVTSMSLVGYITLLHVHSPFRKPRPGIIARVCQALILPPYHRAGHGSTMLQALHEYADVYSTTAGSVPGMGILEVNVEDPAPAFVAMRDSVDYQRFISTICAPAKKNDSTDASNVNGTGGLNLEESQITSKEYFLPVSEEHLSFVVEALKVTKRQSQIILEVYKLAQVEEWKQKILTTAKHDTDASNEELIRQIETYYRLMVKKSIRSHRMEELGACEGGKEGQKALLGKWFEETVRHYHRVLGSKQK